MKPIINLLLLTLLLGFGTVRAADQGAPAAAGTPPAQPMQLLDRIVAVVNDGVITQSQLQRQVELVQKELGPNAPPQAALERRVLQQLISQSIQLQLAKRNGLVVDDVQLNQAMQNIAEKNNMTLNQFHDKLVAEGVDYNYFRDQIRNQVIISQLHRQQIASQVHVTDQEINDLIANENASIEPNAEYHLAQILITIPDGASPEQIKQAHDKAEMVRDKLLKGDDFAKLAAEYSQGQNALKGGDLGWRRAAQLPQIFVRSVALMKPGDISKLIRSPSGFHIVKLIDKRGVKQVMVTETHARHILIKADALTSSEQARAKLESLRNRIVDGGASFAALARANSDDKGSAAKGGDLGWVTPGELVPQFEKVMNSLAPGQISEPFRTQYGWHIVQVLGRRKVNNTNALIRDRARQYLFQRKVEEATQLWLQRQRDDAYVDILVPSLKPQDGQPG
ncbi:MAG: peptidylprolyl isomerase [Gammaproteobacteria bacterium]